MDEARILNANLAVVVRRWPEIAQALQRVDAVALRLAAGGAPLLEGRRLVSATDPHREARILATAIPVDAGEAWVYGPGPGYLPRILLQRAALRRLHVVVLNPGFFRALLALADETDWLDNDRLELEMPQPDAVVHSPCAAVPGCLAQAVPGAAAELAARIGAELDTAFINRSVWENQVLKRRLEEAPALLDADGDVASLFGAHPGATVVAVGGGPTLSAQLPWLRQRRAELILVAGTAAIRPLLEAGLTADAVVAIDPKPEKILDLDADLGGYGETPLVYLPLIDPALRAMWPGPKLAFYSQTSPLFEALRRQRPRGELSVQGSVAHPAADLAARMGAATVIFAGFDFGYAGGATYAAGTAPRRNRAEAGDRWLTDGRGAPIKTNADLSRYLIDLERLIANWPATAWLNASRDGARIRGAAPMDQSPLAAWLEAAGQADAQTPPSPMAAETDDPEALAARGIDQLRHARFAAAQQSFEALLEWRESQGEAAGIAAAHHLLARLDLARGRETAAQAWIDKALAGWKQCGDRLNRARTLLLKVPGLVGCGAASEAVAILREAADILTASSDGADALLLGTATGVLGDGLGNPLAAWPHLERMADLAREGEMPWDEAEICLTLGEMMERRGKTDLALRWIGRAVAAYDKLDAPFPAARARTRIYEMESRLWRGKLYQGAAARELIVQAEEAFRRGAIAEGSAALVALTDRLAAELSQGGVDLQRLQDLVNRIVEGQQKQDYIHVADLLADEAAPLLAAASGA